MLINCWCGNEWQQSQSVLYTSLRLKLSWHGSSKPQHVMLLEASKDFKIQMLGLLGECIAQAVSMSTNSLVSIAQFLFDETRL